MNKKYLVILVILVLASCSRSFYFDTTENEYNEAEAIEIIKGLKKGTLLVQLPCERRKLEVMKKVVAAEKDLDKKAIKQKELDDYQMFLKNIQLEIINNFHTKYSFSKFAFIPDTLVKSFKNGVRNNLFVNSSLEIIDDVPIADDELVLFLRSHRDYDYFYFHKMDGSYPPKPFPYNTNISTLEAPAKGTHMPFERRTIEIHIKDAIGNIDKKLISFYEQHYFSS
ncbi:MAG: hypothetical protein P1U56_10850 [Saprospiraceae bacterium]|nr:hypothetical protein [Saprospiraceae bacterium]